MCEGIFEDLKLGDNYKELVNISTEEEINER